MKKIIDNCHIRIEFLVKEKKIGQALGLLYELQFHFPDFKHIGKIIDIANDEQDWQLAFNVAKKALKSHVEEPFLTEGQLLVLYDNLSYSSYWLKLYNYSYETTLKMLEINPNDKRVAKNLESLEHVLSYSEGSLPGIGDCSFDERIVLLQKYKALENKTIYPILTEIGGHRINYSAEFCSIWVEALKEYWELLLLEAHLLHNRSTHESIRVLNECENLYRFRVTRHLQDFVIAYQVAGDEINILFWDWCFKDKDSASREKIKISIIVPMHNVESHIENCLKSIMHQTYQNIEIILVDDGSKDRTLEIVREIAKVDRRLIIECQENKGANSARFAGFRKASGDYIAFVDADDWVNPEMVEKMADAINLHNVDVIRCKAVWEAPGNVVNIDHALMAEQVMDKKKIRDYLFPKMLSTYHLNPLWGQLIRKSCVIDEIFETVGDLSVAEDALFNTLLLEKVESYYLLDEFLYHYNQANAHSITKHVDYEKVEKNVLDCFAANSKIHSIVKKYGLRHDYCQTAKLLYEVSTSIERIMALDLDEELRIRRKSFVEELINKEFFHSIRKNFPYDKISLGKNEIGSLIMSGDIDGIEKMFE